MISINNNFNQNSIGHNIPVSNEPVTQPSVSESSIQSVKANLSQNSTGVNSAAMQKSLDIQQQLQQPGTDKKSNNLGLTAPDKMPSQHIEKPAVGNFSGTNIISQLEEDEKPLTAETAPSFFRNLISNIDDNRINDNEFHEVEPSALFKDGTMATMAMYIKAGNEHFLSNAFFGGMSIDDKNTLYSLLNHPQFEKLAEKKLSTDDLNAIHQFKSDFNSLTIESEVNTIKDQMLHEGRVSHVFAKENHSVFDMFCRAIANFIHSIFGGEIKSLDQDDFANKAREFGAQHGYALHMIMKNGGMKPDDLTKLLLSELKSLKLDNEEKLAGYAANMSDIMLKEMENWENGAGAKILEDINKESFIPSLLVDNYSMADTKDLSHELYHLLVASNFDSGYLDRIKSCVNHLENNSRAKASMGLAELSNSLKNVYKNLPDVQQSKLRQVWPNVRSNISAIYDQGLGSSNWDDIKEKLDNLFEYREPEAQDVAE